MGTIKTYKEQRYATVVLDSGEAVMLSVAQDGIAIFKMRFAGLIPGPRIGSWAPIDLDRFLEVRARGSGDAPLFGQRWSSSPPFRMRNHYRGTSSTPYCEAVRA